MARQIHFGMLSQSKLNKFLLEYASTYSLQCSIRPEWSSKNPDHRLAIRLAIQDCVGDFPRLLDLGWVPDKIHNRFVSISHCPEAGGFILANVPVGFDLEEPAKVTLPVVSRLSSSQEVLHAPHPAALWSAKEAAYKSLVSTQTQPPVMSQIEIFGWIQNSEEFWKFQYRPCTTPNPGGSSGVVYLAPNIVCAIAFFHSTLVRIDR
ncbi:MAG: hypothetical protein N2578_03185 [Bdellovibrionaceae bacterium]|nr:hypothetical protein [Pseudobdellovibrionaceae bacterium]